MGSSETPSNQGSFAEPGSPVQSSASPSFRSNPTEGSTSASGAPALFDEKIVRRAVLTVAALNFAYFFVEFAVALQAGSVSLLADSVDYLEDTSVNILIFIALGWPLAKKAMMGKFMAVLILAPASFAAWQAIQRFSSPEAPDVVPLVVVSIGAIVINGASALIISRVRHHGGSLSSAAFLSARNDVLINITIIVMGLITAATSSGWPDLILGCFIIVLALHAAYEVWEVSEEERLAAKALAGEEID